MVTAQPGNALWSVPGCPVHRRSWNWWQWVLLCVHRNSKLAPLWHTLQSQEVSCHLSRDAITHLLSGLWHSRPLWSVPRQRCLSSCYKAPQKVGLTPNMAEVTRGYRARLIRCPALGGLSLIPYSREPACFRWESAWTTKIAGETWGVGTQSDWKARSYFEGFPFP